MAFQGTAAWAVGKPMGPGALRSRKARMDELEAPTFSCGHNPGNSRGVPDLLGGRKLLQVGGALRRGAVCLLAP